MRTLIVCAIWGHDFTDQKQGCYECIEWRHDIVGDKERKGGSDLMKLIWGSDFFLKDHYLPGPGISPPKNESSLVSDQ